MKTKNLLKMCITCTVILCASCNFAAKNRNAVTSADASAADSMKLNLNLAAVERMTLILSDSEKQFPIEGIEREIIGKALETCVNDTIWNNDGKMRKMPAPDFTLTLHYSGKPANEIRMVQVWRQLSKIHTDRKWYLLGMSGKEIFAIVDTYKE